MRPKPKKRTAQNHFGLRFTVRRTYYLTLRHPALFLSISSSSSPSPLFSLFSLSSHPNCIGVILDCLRLSTSSGKTLQPTEKPWTKLGSLVLQLHLQTHAYGVSRLWLPFFLLLSDNPFPSVFSSAISRFLFLCCSPTHLFARFFLAPSPPSKTQPVGFPPSVLRPPLTETSVRPSDRFRKSGAWNLTSRQPPSLGNSGWP